MRKDPTEVYNTIRVDYKDRYNFYNDVPAEAKDEAHVELYGPRIDNIGLANEFSHVNYATMSSLAQLRRNIGIMRTYTWKMNPLWAWLRPMDIITIPDPTDYTKTVGVRVTDIEDDEDENITVTAEEFGAALPTEPTTRMLASFDGSDLNFRWGGANSPTFIPTAQSTPPNQGATNNPPQPAYPPVTFEPTTAMLTAMGFSTPQIIFGCSGGAGGTLDPNWGGVDVWISLDNISYELMGRIIGAATCGFVTSAVPAFAGVNPDVTHTIYVSLMQSDGELASSTDSAASAGHSICVMQDDDGFEAFAYVNATLSSPFTYVLTGLYRGLYGTTPRAFAPGAKFMFVGSNANFLAHNLPAAYIGQNFWVKPQSFNTFYIMEEDLSDVTAYRYFVGGPTPGFSLSDSATSHDQFTFAGQYVRTLQDLTAAVDAATSTSGLAIHVSDSAASADALTP
jgi:hypothetical protein